MIGITLCSGIGAPEVAAPWVDWRLAAEIEPFPRAVLQQRHGYTSPDAQNQGELLLWDDMTTVSPELMRSRGLPIPELMVAGTPCQAFSVAGLRKGLDDERGNLTLELVRIVHDFVAARPDGKFTLVWENVPGVLSDKGNAFGCFLGGLVGAVDAIPPDTDGRWAGEGMVSGPRGRAAWCILDAQWFGVAQRRRRVFVIADFGHQTDPAAILFEPQSVCGDTPPRREARKVAPTTPSRSTGGGGLGTDFELDGGLIANQDWPAEVTCTLNAAFGSKLGIEDQHINSGAPLFVPSAVGPLTAGMGKGPRGTEAIDSDHILPMPIAFDCKGTEVQTIKDGSHPTLRSMGHHASHQNAGGHAAVAFDLRGRDGGSMPEGPHETVNLRASSGGSSRSYIAQPWAVRRLTPLECERLQGFPDNFTAITWRGKAETPDGPRYKALGNSMAVPVMRWILDRVRISFEQHKSKI